jgi:pimeloyl-ACP methyl ester carboxylesterase
MMIDTRAIAVPGGSLHTATAGDPANPAAVLVHAGIAHSDMWTGLMRAMSDELFLVAYDCRCFGRSVTSLEGTYSDVADLASVLDAYGLDSALLVGASRGTRVAIDFTLAHPERVRGLFLAAPDVSGYDAPATDAERALLDAMEAADDAGDTEGIIAGEARLLIDGPLRDQDDRRAAIRASVAEMARVSYAQQDKTPDFEPFEPPAAGRLADITCPVRVLTGDVDTTGMKAMAAAVETGCPRATLVEVADAAHMLVLEHPDVVERELRGWVRTL